MDSKTLLSEYIYFLQDACIVYFISLLRLAWYGGNDNKLNDTCIPSHKHKHHPKAKFDLTLFVFILVLLSPKSPMSE
jgi:hypothetical protein